MLDLATNINMRDKERDKGGPAPNKWPLGSFIQARGGNITYRSSWAVMGLYEFARAGGTHPKHQYLEAHKLQTILRQICIRSFFLSTQLSPRERIWKIWAPLNIVSYNETALVRVQEKKTHISNGSIVNCADLFITLRLLSLSITVHHLSLTIQLSLMVPDKVPIWNMCRNVTRQIGTCTESKTLWCLQHSKIKSDAD